MYSDTEVRNRIWSQRSQVVLGLAIGLVIFLFLGIYKFLEIRSAIAEGSKRGPPPQAVSTVIVEKQSWHPHVEASARIEPVKGALIRAQTSGRIQNVNFEDGSQVSSGDLLLEIDSETERADFKAAEAKADLAQSTLKRQQHLYDIKAISEEEFDSARQSFLSLKASAEGLKSKLDKKLIVAPFSGTIGVRRVNIGQFVKEGDALFQLQNDSDVYLSFALGNSDAERLNIGDKLNYQPSNDRTKNYAARIMAIDPNLSRETGTRMVKAKFEESPNDMTVGSFGKVYIELKESVQAFLIPASGIQHAPYGDSVFLVKTEKTEDKEEIKIANPSFIKVFDQRGDLVAVTEGISDGDEVVTSGTFKLSKGTKLIINNQNPMDVSEYPNPDNS